MIAALLILIALVLLVSVDTDEPGEQPGEIRVPSRRG